MAHYDLHQHLEGCHSPAALLDIARAFEIRDPVFFDARAPYQNAASNTVI